MVSEHVLDSVIPSNNLAPRKKPTTAHQSQETMDDRMKVFEQQLAEQRIFLQEQMAAQKAEIAEHRSQMAELFQFLKNQEKRPVEIVNESTIAETSNPPGIHVNQSPRNLNFMPKLEFPIFNGNHPRDWLEKCTKYFNLCKISDSQRFDLASLYMNGRAESWYNSYVAVRGFVN